MEHGLARKRRINADKEKELERGCARMGRINADKNNYLMKNGTRAFGADEADLRGQTFNSDISKRYASIHRRQDSMTQ
jgi:hypothetical protein